MRGLPMCTPHRLRRRGTIIPLVAVSLTALLGLIALAIDLGLVALARAQAQSLADAAALNGTRQLNGDAATNNNLAAAQAAAVTAATDNAILGVPPTAGQVATKTGIYTYDPSAMRFT